MKSIIFFSIITLSLTSKLFSARHISDSELWSHVLTVDRLTWLERDEIKKVSDISQDSTFVRRLYVDITGKIPTYDQLMNFLNDKDVNKREKLIDRLLDTPGYASHLANMWGDLLRIPYREGGVLGNHHMDYKKYVERAVYENKPYDQFVYDMLTSEGHVIQNGGISFYYRDYQTSPMDTINATVKAFLGTRIGCAQCHNHRFDKWTQKDFYELTAHMWGVEAKQTHGTIEARVISNHANRLKDNGYKGPLTKNMLYVLTPSRQRITFNKNKRLTFPENYVYNNAKPKELVKEKIVFDYGDEVIKGEDRRDVFAKWLTSKNNPMFARIMANRLWKRIMGVGLMEPVDDWKDNISIQNPKLFNALGDIFIQVNYDFKAFFSIIYNAEAYQMMVDDKNELNSKNYKLQGSVLKRMSAPQLRDSLYTLTYGNLDRFTKLGSRYFEFEDRLRKYAFEFHELIVPKTKAFLSKYGLEGRDNKTDPEMMNHMLEYVKKVRDLEKEYNIGADGYIGSKNKNAVVAKSNSMMSEKNNKNKAMVDYGSGKHTEAVIKRANLVTDPVFMDVFGATDRSSPENSGSSDASIKQILKMINSPECHDAVKRGSYLMRNLYKQTAFNDRIEFLYYSIYGRKPSSREIGIAKKYIDKVKDHELWANYTLALINSPEFYFVQ